MPASQQNPFRSTILFPFHLIFLFICPVPFSNYFNKVIKPKRGKVSFILSAAVLGGSTEVSWKDGPPKGLFGEEDDSVLWKMKLIII